MLIHVERKELCSSCGTPLKEPHYFQGARVCKECKLELDEGYRREQLGNLWYEQQVQRRDNYALIGCFVLWFIAVIGACLWIALV